MTLPAILRRLWRVVRRTGRRAVGKPPAGQLEALDRDVVTVLRAFRG